MTSANDTCDDDLQTYQHHVYAVVYSVILAPGLLGNVLALWVFRVYVRETKKAVVFMMNLAMADLLQVRISLCLFHMIILLGFCLSHQYILYISLSVVTSLLI